MTEKIEGYAYLVPLGLIDEMMSYIDNMNTHCKSELLNVQIKYLKKCVKNIERHGLIKITGEK